MDKDEAIEYIKAAGNSTETAEDMLKYLDGCFGDGTDILPNDVFDVIIDGMGVVHFGYEV